MDFRSWNHKSRLSAIKKKPSRSITIYLFIELYHDNEFKYTDLWSAVGMLEHPIFSYVTEKFTAALQLRKTQLKHFKQIHITELYSCWSDQHPHLFSAISFCWDTTSSSSDGKWWTAELGLTLQYMRREDLTIALKSLCIMTAWCMWLESEQMHLSNHHVLEEKLAMVYSPSLNDHPVFKHVWTTPWYVTQMAAVITDVPQPAFTTHSHTKTH